MNGHDELRVGVTLSAPGLFIHVLFTDPEQLIRYVHDSNTNLGRNSLATYRFAFDGAQRAQWLWMKRVVELYFDVMTDKTVLIQSSLFPRYTFSSAATIGRPYMASLNFLRYHPTPP